MPDYREEIDDLKRQVRGDFAFTCAALKDLGNQMESQTGRLGAQMVELAAQVTAQMSHMSAETTRMGAEWNERIRQVEGRMRLLDQRFDSMLTAVQNQQGSFGQQLQSLDERVTRLEELSPPAA